VVSDSAHKTGLFKYAGFADLPAFIGIRVNAGFAFPLRFFADFLP